MPQIQIDTALLQDGINEAKAYTDLQTATAILTANGYTDTEIAAVVSGFKGSLSLADPTPTEDGVYFFSQTGTYTNFGNLVIDLTQGLVYGTKVGSTYTETIIPITLTDYVSRTTDLTTVSLSGKNLFNKATVNVGAIDGNTGLPTVSANSRYSDYIEVVPGKKYTVSGRNTGTNPALVYYDANHVVKTPPPYGTNWNGGPINGTYLISEGVKYIRMIVQFGGLGSPDTVQFEEGEAATTYEAFTLTPNVETIIGDSLVAKYISTSNGYADYNEIGLIETEYVPGINMFDKNSVTIGSLNAIGGSPVTSPTSRVSGWIPVEGGESYYISRPDGGNQTLVTYKADKTVTTVGGNYGLGPLSGIYTMPNDAAFVRFIAVFSGTGNVDTVQFEKGVDPTEYQPYEANQYVRKLNGLDILPVEIERPEVNIGVANQAVKYSGGRLTIISKYSKDYNIRIIMAEGLANDLFCVNSAFLIPNSGVISASDFTSANSKEVLRGTSTDLIGPYILNGTGFVSGNHLAGPSGTSKTAKMLSVNVYADGVELSDSISIHDAKEVVVKMKTEVYDYTDLASNIETVNFNEYHTYRIIDGKIEAIIEQVAVRNCSFTRLYGVQNVSMPDVPNIYVAHSAIKTTQAYDNTANYGTKPSYPNVEKAIFSSSDSKYCVAVDMDRTRGLGLNPQSVDSSTASYLVANVKGYHVLIYSTTTPRLLNIGEKMFYRGTYHPFENLSSDPNVFAYIQKDNITGNKYLFVDFARTETSDKLVSISSPELIGKILEVAAADSTITTTSDLFVLGDGVTVKSTGYGNIKILIK